MSPLPVIERRVSYDVSSKSFIVHMVGFILHCFGTTCDFVYYTRGIHSNFGGRLQYLTSIGQFICFASCGYSTLADLMLLVGVVKGPDSANVTWIVKLRDHLMSLWNFTLGSFVSVMYIAIATIDLDGIHPAEERKVLPVFSWFNFYLHLFPLLYAYAAMCLVAYQFTSHVNAIWLMLVFDVVYMSWMAVTRHFNGFWPYGFMERFSSGEYLLFCVFCFFCAVAFQLLCRLFANAVWRGARIDEVFADSKKLN